MDVIPAAAVFDMLVTLHNPATYRVVTGYPLVPMDVIAVVAAFEMLLTPVIAPPLIVTVPMRFEPPALIVYPVALTLGGVTVNVGTDPAAVGPVIVNVVAAVELLNAPDVMATPPTVALLIVVTLVMLPPMFKVDPFHVRPEFAFK